MKKFNFAMMAILCLCRIEADEGTVTAPPVEKVDESTKKTEDEKSQTGELLLSLNTLSDTLSDSPEVALAEQPTPTAPKPEDIKPAEDKKEESQAAVEKEDSAAKIAYKNQVRYTKNKKTGKKGAKVVSQEMVITLSKDFFDKEENKSIKFSPGFDEDSVIKISYEKKGDQKPVALLENEHAAAPEAIKTQAVPAPSAPKEEIKEQEKTPAPQPIAEADPVLSPTQPTPPPIEPEPKKEPVRDSSKEPVIEKAEKTPSPISYANETNNIYNKPYSSRVHVVDMTNQSSNQVADADMVPQSNISLARSESIGAPVQNQNAPQAWAPPYVEQDNSCIQDNACAQQECCPPPATQLNLGYTFGRGIETSHNYATANLLLFPNWNTRNIVPFISLSAHHLDNNRWAGSYGGGARWQPEGACHIWGFNLFYDTLKRHLGTFQQVGAGLEWLSPTWEGRINAYLPVGAQSRFKTVQFFEYPEGQWIKIRERDRSARGFDAEIGWNTYFCDQYRFYLGVGPAWFEKHHSNNEQWAFKARALLQWSRYLSLEARTYKESNSSWHWQGAVFLTIPFECIRDLCSCGLTDLFARPVYRNALIKSSSDCCWETNY